MYKDGFDEGEKVKDACEEISDSVSERIEDLNEVKNKGVFRWADKEYDIRNVIFRSMSKNDVEKETNADKQSNSNKLENVSSLNTSSSEVDAVNDCTIKDNGDEVVVFDEEIVEEGSKKVAKYNLWIFCWMQYESCMCHNGTGISAFARILVEMDASKEFKDTIEIQYKDKSNTVIRTKFMKVEFSWKPKTGNAKPPGKEQVKESIAGTRKDEGNAKVQYKYVPKNDGNKKQMGTESNNQMNETQFKTPEHGKSHSKKTWNVGSKNVEELRRSANKYSILANNEENVNEYEEFRDRRLEVDKMENECESESDDDLIYEENEATNNVIADEIEGVDTGVLLN
ncbi:hypothetical protein Tco_0398393 [Tanacetum coccineum]